MDLTGEFNEKYKAQMDNDYVLSICYSSRGGNQYLAYDFMSRLLITRGGGYEVTVTPFSELDRETLIKFRDELVRQGGKPPELPPDTPATQAAARKFNL